MAENKSVEAPVEARMYSLTHCEHAKAPTSSHDQVRSIDEPQKKDNTLTKKNETQSKPRVVMVAVDVVEVVKLHRRTARWHLIRFSAPDPSSPVEVVSLHD